MMKNVNDGVLNMVSNEFTTIFQLIVYYELLPMTTDEREEFVKKNCYRVLYMLVHLEQIY